MAYAKDTSVSVERSKAEIERVVMKYGAASFASFSSRDEARIAFEASGRHIIFVLPLPSQDDDRFKKIPAKRRVRRPEQQYAAWEQECRAKWRALLLCIRAKLESVEAGIETFEEAFLAHVMMPDGRTIADHITPRIEIVYKSGKIQPLLPGPTT